MTAMSETEAALSGSSKYVAYPEYKDSGIEWLDVIPTHWVLSKVKYIAPFQVGWTPPTKNDENFIGDNLWVNISDLKGKVITNTSKRISNKAAKEASMSITPKGSLMYSFKLSVGAVSFAGDDMYTNEAIASFLNSARLPLSYLYYALPKFVVENASTNIYGARILNQELINNAQLLEPTFAEAEKIANFLDHETAKIDTLIGKQQQLIKLLKEKRQAVISHAVTKGISYEGQPHVSMKDSGVEWLGEVPEHWVILALRRVIQSMEQGKSPECESTPSLNGQWGVLKTSCVNNGIFHAGENKALPSYTQPHKKYEVKAGDVLMSRASGSIKLIGSVAIAQAGVRDKLLLSDKVFRIHLSPKLMGEYFSYLMATPYMRTLVERAISGAEGMANNITKSSIMEFVGILPPLEEQAEIVEHINNQCKRFDELISKAVKGSSLLQERRTALISAAVTGKIDVRHFTLKEGQASANKEVQQQEAG